MKRVTSHEPPQKPPVPPTKKNQILALYHSGVSDIHELALITHAKPSYVATILQDAGLITGYFDLYTHTSSEMNIYSRRFHGKVGFKDIGTAQDSVRFLENAYDHFAVEEDRAGQHHALGVALTMFNRARWSGKRREAEIFRQWLAAKLLVEEEGAVDDA